MADPTTPEPPPPVEDWPDASAAALEAADEASFVPDDLEPTAPTPEGPA